MCSFIRGTTSKDRHSSGNSVRDIVERDQIIKGEKAKGRGQGGRQVNRVNIRQAGSRPGGRQSESVNRSVGNSKSKQDKCSEMSAGQNKTSHGGVVVISLSSPADHHTCNGDQSQAWGYGNGSPK